MSFLLKEDGSRLLFEDGGARLLEGTGVPAVPNAPVQNAAIPGNLQVALSWNAVSNATSYKIFRSTASGAFNFAAPLASGVTTTTYTDATAQNGTQYFYVVRATNATGDSASSNQQSATPSAAPPPPAVLDHINVSPSSTSIATGGQQQFTASGRSSSNQIVTGITFAWRSSNAGVVAINSATGLATAQALGSALVYARDPATNIESAGASVVVVAAPTASTGVMYLRAYQAFARGQINWIGDTIKVCLIDLAAYTVSITADEFLTSIPQAARLAISPALESKTSVGKALGAESTLFRGVTGTQAGAIAVFQDTGKAETSRLIAHISFTPITLDGGNILIAWNPDPSIGVVPF